jgi:hypothetical protein
MACAVLSSFPIWSCSVWGLPCLVHCCASGALLPHLFTLTATAEHLRLRRLAPALPLHPAQSGSAYAVHLSAAVYFLWHFPSSHFSAAPKRATKAPSRTLSGTLLCGVRTFLSLGRAARETPASAAQTATIRFGISYPYYKMSSTEAGFRAGYWTKSELLFLQ